jgi:hypothetical protein
MTEGEFNRCTDPETMLAFLQAGRAGRRRKLWLFACACCRHAWLSSGGKGRGCPSVDVAERFADGRANQEELWAGFSRADGARVWGDRPGQAAYAYVTGDVDVAVRTATGLLGPRPEVQAAGRALYAWLLRDVFGPLPFRPVAPDPAWLAWRGGTVPRLARAAYDDRAFDRLPVLADALEEAGCDDADILGHLRGPGPHARGCWVVDALLGWE